MNNLINGVNLQQIADYIIDTDRKDSLTKIPDKSIIWCKTDFLANVFNELKNNNNQQHVLITHCSDHSITENIFKNRPKCIKKWFAQNVDYLDPMLVPVPIGVENHMGTSRGNNTDFKYLSEQVFDFKIKNKIINKLYCNFRLTHHSRLETANILIKNNIGIFENDVSFKQYTKSIKEYLFVASPRGNGIDAHRTWETLYYGSIPIVEKHFMYDNYQLPIIQISNWNDVTYDMLKPFVEKYKNKQINFDTKELTLQYWLDKIKSTVKQLN